jgi:hypothetical protein
LLFVGTAKIPVLSILTIAQTVVVFLPPLANLWCQRRLSARREAADILRAS